MNTAIHTEVEQPKAGISVRLDKIARQTILDALKDYSQSLYTGDPAGRIRKARADYVHDALIEAEAIVLEETAHTFPLEAEWQPMSTSPMDGTRILLGWPTHVMVGFYGPKYSSQGMNYGDAWGNGTSWNDYLDGMTHWMPLPDPPKPNAQEAK